MPVKIIAEIGINHDGVYDRAESLVREAAAAGVWAVKFQYRNLDNAYADGASEIGDEILSHEIEKTYLEPALIVKLSHLAHDLGMKVGISYFDAPDMHDFVEEADVFDFHKVPSAELSSTSLIDAMLATGNDVFISTGAHTEKEVEEALSRIANHNWLPFHCISNYPTALQNAQLGYITHMQQRWARDVGFSSHDDNWEVCLLAMQLGASVIERHITLDKQAQGLDHSTSSTPDEFLKLCSFAANMDAIMAGNAERSPNQGELMNRQNLGRSFHAGHDIAKGDIIRLDDLVYRSPNVGLGGKAMAGFVGKPALHHLCAGAPLSESDFVTPELLSDAALAFAQKKNVSLPVRLHDMNMVKQQFPLNAFEFHLSFNEVRSDLSVKDIDPDCRYSIHLPDYVSSTQLMDPFSGDANQSAASMDLIKRTASFANALQDLTGNKVPVVGSFSVIHDDLDLFFDSHADLIRKFQNDGVDIMPQWLPPIAWYFGGSVRLNAMNNLADMEQIKRHDLMICMDVCHLIMGRNYFGFDASDVIERLSANVGHVHIADAAGIDGEGLQFGDGEHENLDLLRRSLDFDCIKVIEVWQGHLDRGAGFRKSLQRFYEVFGDE